MVQAVFVTINTVDCDICCSTSADDNDAVPGVLTAEIDVVLGTLDVTGTMPLTRPSLSEEMLAVSKDLIKVEEVEQLFSVTVVLSVTVTIDTGKGFFRVDVEVFGVHV